MPRVRDTLIGCHVRYIMPLTIYAADMRIYADAQYTAPQGGRLLDVISFLIRATRCCLFAMMICRTLDFDMLRRYCCQRRHRRWRAYKMPLLCCRIADTWHAYAADDMAIVERLPLLLLLLLTPLIAMMPLLRYTRSALLPR